MPSRLNLQPGTTGIPLKVITNSFLLNCIPPKYFYHYNVVFPDFEKFPGRTTRLDIIKALQETFSNTFSPMAAYDGHSNMFRVKALSLPEGAIFEVPRGNGPKSRRDRVKLTLVATIKSQTILDVMHGNVHSSQSLTLFNIFLNMAPIMTYPSNARSFFTGQVRDSLGNGLELWRGFFQSVRPSIGRVLVNVDIASAVFYSEGSLLELVKAYLGVKDNRDLTPKSSDMMDKKLRRLIDFLKNLQVCSTTPRQTPPRWKRIKEVVMVGADDYKFDIEATGESTTVSQYYLKTYSYRVHLGKIICIGIGRAVFPLEVLDVRQGQFYKKTLPPFLTAKLLKFATQKPAERKNSIVNARTSLAYDSSEYLSGSGISIGSDLLDVEGRVLPSPPIQWGEGSQPDAPSGGSGNLIGKVFRVAETVKAWAVVIYDSKLDSAAESLLVQTFLKHFMVTCRKLKMTFPDKYPPVIRGRLNPNDERIHNDMEQAASQAMATFDAKRPTFIFIIMPPSAPELRIAIKNWGDCVRGCPTQCMNGDKLRIKAIDQYCANLALKVNVKIGGVNFTLGRSKVMATLLEHPTMIIGADVSHAGPGSCHPSVVGFVSSVDDKFARYVASSGLQASRTEMIQNLDGFIEGAVRSFFEYWGFQRTIIVPSRIIFYRDGVSEGELDAVRKEEVNVIKAKLKNLWIAQKFPTPIPKLTFIIVGKRHHVRFFPKDSYRGDRSGNCPAGLIVDQGIVNPVDYDFFLQSHAGLLGTSRPSHYIVLEDENAFGADMLQGISFALCHVYARATRSVSIPAPVYYADIVASRGRIHSTMLRESGGDASSTGKGSQGPDLAEYQENFQKIAERLKRSMYFM